ncbi:SF-assemblin/beta giardin family protein (macronuclear) [Tetrahymena thermophila SB210]|uniref:SF-assemblin/beta giardin family protein n=1 Tax=Tetrahymena thermophila (strain SB210) TaxID=312017 RepID=Q22U54_TETTS|nr:SF-assemblin/beta giardin family protein [Tetrahymena thermophila SB210]EAR88833.2 SF-assemblin/beta giardin family protein [Tetrahymena thermophila SB210]|eukprot:XP_001009078.2 SF-assemblin/beta giardin family protein [Tetrahymena thermophila SB210]
MNKSQAKYVDAENNKPSNKKYGLIKRNQSQLILVFLGLLPSFILIISTFISLWYLQQQSMLIIQQFSDQLYQDQINSSKQHNRAVIFQINQQVQKIPWQLSIINEFVGYQLLGKVKNSKKYVPALHNVDRTYLNKENTTVIKMFKKNPILTSVWHQVNKAYLQQLNQIELSQLQLLTKVDFLQKSIKYDNLHEVTRWMKIDNTIINLAQNGNGIVYMLGTNKTYSTYQPPSDCPYKGTYNFDPRCRYFYQPTVGNISTVVFPPTMNLGATGLYYASQFCQRRVNLGSQNQNDIFSILCITLNLQVLPTYLQNFGNNSKYQMLVDPQSLTVVYNSQTQLQQQVTVNQTETGYLQDQSQANIFIQNLIQNSNYVILNTSSYQQQYSLDNSQQTFEYNRNGTDCLVILNVISMVDKVPKIERNRLNNPAPKFQLKNVYLFLDLWINLYNFNNTILLLDYFGEIHIKSYNPSDINTDYVNSSQIVFNQMQTDQVNQILIDEQIDADFEGLCHSRDTQDLLNSFQDMFKVLRFTTQNFYKEDASLQLLNLIKQIQHFQRFGNHRALGVCYNNMGVIHYNCGRFQEASENFQQAIIYASYELNAYSHHHQGETVEFSQSLKRLTAHLRSSIQNNLSLEFTEDVSNLNISICQEKQKQKNQYNQLQSYQVELYWSLFNRKTNLIKAMSMFIINSNNKLWDIIEDYAYENIIISQIYLPPSNKREMINYYILSNMLQKQNSDNEAIQVLNRLNYFYVKIQESKYGKQSQENQKQIDVNTAQSINSQQKRELYSDIFINQSKNIQISNINQPSNNMSYNNDTNNSFILYSPIKKTKSMSKKINIQEKIKDKVQNLFNPQNNNFLNKLQINFQKINKNLSQENEPDQNNQKVNQSKLKNSIYASKKNKGIYNNQKKSIINEGKEKNQDKITNQIFQQPQNKFLADSQSQNEFHNILQKQRFSILKNILSQQEVSKSSNQKSKKYTKFILKKKDRAYKATVLENNKFIFYPVRKHKDNDKVIKYEYSSDIYFQYCSIEHASYLIKQQNFYNAAVMLTSSFEMCQYYLPHLRKIQMDMLFNIFQQQNIKSKDFEIANKRYSQMTSSNFNIYLISACQMQSVKFKLYALCNDLVNEILFKDNDSFGLIQYSFEEQIFMQLIASTQILLQLLPKKQANHTQKFKNDKIQLQEKNNLVFPQSTSNLPSLNQINVLQDINLQSFQNSNLNLKTGSIFRSDNYHSNKKAQNQKSDLESFNANDLISSCYPNQKLNFAKNEFLEQIELGQDTSQTSLESNIIPNQIQFYQTKKNIKQHNITKLLTQKYFQTISNLNSTLKIKSNSQKQFQQPQSINNSNIPFKEDNLQQIYTFMDDEFKEDSVDIKNLLKKNGQNTQNNSNNSSCYNIQLQKSDSENTQNLVNLEIQEQKITSFDQLKNQQAIQCQFSTSPKSSYYKNRQQSVDQDQKKVSMHQQKSFLPNQIQIFNTSNQNQQPPSDNAFEIDLFMLKSSPTSKQISPLNQFQHLHDDQNKSYQPKSYQNQFVDQKVSQDRKQHETKIQQFKSSEYVFHLGIHACLKQFILNSDEKLSIHLTQNNHKQLQSNKKYEPQQNQQTYLIYITDQYFQITKSNLMQELTHLLISIGTELLILVLNDTLQFDESSDLENVSIDGKQIISFFNSEQKMLQYIYNSREHLKNYLMPMSMVFAEIEYLYQDQINNSKQNNRAVLFQINQQIQKIPWQLNLINEFVGYQLLGQIKNSNKYIPALNNVDRTYLNQENTSVINMFKKNPILTSAWHQINKTYLYQLNQIELSQFQLLTKVDFFQKSFEYDNLNEVTRWIKIDNIFNNLAYDGLSYMLGTNKTYSNYQPPDDCPYKGTYNFDSRCRYYYQPTVGNISTVLYPPNINVGPGGAYYGSTFCQRRINLGSQKQNDIFSVLCITINLGIIPTYFQNFGNSSLYQMLVDPQSLKVLYNSQAQLQQQVTVMQTETNYLQDQSQANIFIKNLTQNSNYVILNTSSYQLTYLFDNSQQTFEYNRNGTDCLVILNVISIVDKVPKVEINRSSNPAPKFQLKKVFLFLDVLTKENLQIYATNLQNTIYFYNKIFAYTSYGLICIILIIQIYYTIILGKLILNPIIHLTYILRKIRIQNLNSATNFGQKEKITEKLQKNYVNSSQIVFNDIRTDQANQILIDEQFDANFEGLCHSRDTQDLLNSFQDMFKVLRFTTQNFYKEDSSLQLLNLISQIQHFQRFGNHRALGVCYNNMGVIHYNCGRFQEASENFQQAVIYANYELNSYSHDHQGETVKFTQNLKRLVSDLRSSIQNNTTLEYTEDNVRNLNISIYQKKQREKNQDNQQKSHQLELYWSLFNRKTNLIKAMYMFIQNSNNKLWDIIEDYAYENIIISQVYLPPSNKREIISYYTLSNVLQKQNMDNEAIKVLNRLSYFYAKIQESKYEKYSQENQKQTDIIYTQSFNSQQRREFYPNDFRNQSKNIIFQDIKQQSSQNSNIKLKNGSISQSKNYHSNQIVQNQKPDQQLLNVREPISLYMNQKLNSARDEFLEQIELSQDLSQQSLESYTFPNDIQLDKTKENIKQYNLIKIQNQKYFQTIGNLKTAQIAKSDSKKQSSQFQSINSNISFIEDNMQQIYPSMENEFKEDSILINNQSNKNGQNTQNNLRNFFQNILQSDTENTQNLINLENEEQQITSLDYLKNKKNSQSQYGTSFKSSHYKNIYESNDLAQKKLNIYYQPQFIDSIIINMQTTSVLTKKNFAPLKNENEKLNLFANQVDQMRDDFEDMKRSREEAKKQLEAKFQDVHRKIQNTKEFIAAEGKRINDTLLAFQSKFETEMKNIKTYFQKQHDEYTVQVQQRFEKVEDETKRLDKKIDDEREERLRQSDENLREIRKQLETLFSLFDTEKRERIEREKEILQKLDDEAFALKEMLDKEKTERILKIKELRNHTDFELKAQQKFNEDFHAKTIDEFHHVVNNIQVEIDNRFNHQDQIIDNLSKLVKTLQDTLKVIGKDV